LHELPIITRIVELAIAAAPAHSAIRKVSLRVGGLCDADPQWLERYFRIAAKGSAAEYAVLEVHRDEYTPGGDPGAATEYYLESIEILEEKP
jgi:Zn finger protein HypA/HybF involved in hydrogenase expression